MNARKTILTLAAGTLLAAAPAFADPPRWAPAHGSRHNPERVVVVKQRHDHRPAVRQVVVVREPVIVRRTVVVERPVYVQRPVYYGAPPVHAAPIYAGPAHDNVLATLGGAIIGAAIGSQIGHGEGRAAATAIGAVVGGAIGSGL
jgi:uncharacterized protein YcfJ